APDDLVADVIDRPPPPPENSPPPELQLNKIHFTEPPLRPVLAGPVEPAASDGIFAEIPPPTIESRGPGGTAEPEPAISPAGVDLRHPLTQPPYPMSSIRVGEEGAIVVDILVGVDGRVRDAKVSRSSGFERLDQAALSEAKQRWHLKPATRNGVPFEQWLTLKVVFRLQDR
ncbi:MAG TPA: energy transducer TonB, partial [Steroidobacteraceae bacterium]